MAELTTSYLNLSCPDIQRPCFFYQYGIEKKVNPDEEEEDEDEEGFGSTASKKEDDDPVMRKHFTIIGLHHSPDGITNPKYKLLCFVTTKFFLQREERTNFNHDR